MNELLELDPSYYTPVPFESLYTAEELEAAREADAKLDAEIAAWEARHAA